MTAGALELYEKGLTLEMQGDIDGASAAFRDALETALKRGHPTLAAALRLHLASLRRRPRPEPVPLIAPPRP